ncbi:ParB/RepB/Spo0J family partition protein [Spongiactinospora rosea]|nr:winged helix-turn-helix transcriptional regulator [Spongiactinospora rosea]
MTLQMADIGQSGNAAPEVSDLLRDLPAESVPIRDLMPSMSPRKKGEDPAHVRLIVESGNDIDPVLVHRPTMRVIDGAHRLRAAILRGRTEISVQFYDGSEADAFVLSAQLNIRHGLPLTMEERKAAAQRILKSHPHWSDRAVAESTGLSPFTVGALRRKAGAGVDAHSGGRVGRDGKVRPISSVEGRRSAAALLKNDSEISLRELSRRTGLSVGTVRDVRDRLSRGQDPIPAQLRAAPARPMGQAGTAPPPGPDRGPAPAPAGNPARGRPGRPPRDCATGVETATAVRKLARDPSMRATESRRTLLRILLATEMDQTQWEEIADAIPPHCVPLIRAIVLKRCEDWKKLANMVPQ